MPNEMVTKDHDDYTYGNMLFFQVTRYGDWWFYKIPPLVSIAYGITLIGNIPPMYALVSVGGIFISLISLGAFGYIINDIFDIDEDRRAGKENFMAKLSPLWRFSLVVFYLISGFLPFVFLSFGSIAILLLSINYLLPLLYSIPPVRLKERMVWGVIADAAGVHAVPTLFIAVAFSKIAEPPLTIFHPFTIIATIWAFLFGLRGILIHQIWDRKNDIKSGAITYITKIGTNRLNPAFMYILFIVEMLSMLILSLILNSISPIILLLLIGYILLDLIKYVWILKSSFNPAPTTQGAYIPPSDFYEVWLPLGLCASLILIDTTFGIVLLLHLVLFFKRIKIHLKEIVTGLMRLVTPYRQTN